MGGLSALSLSRTSTNQSTLGASEEKEKEKDRGRPTLADKRARSSSQAPSSSDELSRSRSRARSQSPFTFRRFRRDRERDPSPTPQALPLGPSELDFSDASPPTVRPRNAFTEDADSGDDTETGLNETDAETEDEDWSDDDMFDPVTERNTERNALIESPAILADADGDVDPDPLGEGVNVVVPPEPYFPSTLNTYSSGSGTSAGGRKRNARRRKSTKSHEPLTLQTSRPLFQRDRCTLTITQGDPEGKLGERRRRRYIVASDLSEESRYAVEWGIGTVLRDGDEMMIVTVIENESKGKCAAFYFLIDSFTRIASGSCYP